MVLGCPIMTKRAEAEEAAKIDTSSEENIKSRSVAIQSMLNFYIALSLIDLADKLKSHTAWKSGIVVHKTPGA
jgi:hypothetical protein